MVEWFSQFSAFTVFLTIAGIGFVFLLISLIFGELFDSFGNHDFDGVDGGHGGPGFFSSRVISVFIAAFGGFGAVGTHYGLSTVAASGVGFVSGVIFASIIYAFARFLYSQQASSDVRIADVIGQQARVIVAIPAAGLGQVRCHLGEGLVDKIARTRDGQPVPENTVVLIEEILGETVIVRRA